MSRFKKLIGDVDLTRDLKLLLIIGGLYSLSAALSNTFVNIYLWKQSGEFSDLALYNLSIVVMQPLTFILAGRWAKKIDRVIVLRIGVIFLASFYLTVLFIGTDASKFLVLLGALLGVGYGFYWLAFNVLTFEITEPENRDFFNGFLGILTSVGGMIGPIAAGFIISRMEKFTGYSVIFGISLTLFSIAVFLSFFLKRRPANGRYWFRRILSERKNNPNWRMITNAHFFQGLREGTFVFVISVYVFISTGSELALGTYGLVNSGISFMGYFLVSRLLKKQFRKRAILIGGLLLYAAIFFIIFEVTYPKLLMYAATIAIAYPLLLVPYISLTYDVIGRGWKAAEMRIEYIVVREIFLNSGRIVSILSFLAAVTFFNDEKSIPILLAFIGAGHAVIYFFVRKIHFQST
ncbi:YQGE family putative transporter [Cytobacillus oceanisediminis]|jgi:YQGE family putative transporter|uniref:YQGE family putative transporter n=1 Tax=Cytobacillus oceanisediminis TaxID=665099 RepID=A0A2V2ZQG7_9BACI|nr:MFS transporter [Cytobacillus oceanisediminis]PWW26572.1 YQGE family putative transporter [Cytobacillus oceanisediminis]